MEIINSLADIEQLIFKNAYKGINMLTISVPVTLDLEPLKRTYTTLSINEKGSSRKNKTLLLVWKESIYSLSPFENDEW